MSDLRGFAFCRKASFCSNAPPCERGCPICEVSHFVAKRLFAPTRLPVNVDVIHKNTQRDPPPNSATPPCRGGSHNRGGSQFFIFKLCKHQFLFWGTKAEIGKGKQKERGAFHAPRSTIHLSWWRPSASRPTSLGWKMPRLTWLWKSYVRLSSA